MNEEEFVQEAKMFLSKAFSKMPLELKDHFKTIDHLCYRVETIQEYLDLKNKFESFSNLLTEALVGGRNISLFALHHGFWFHDYFIDHIELPAPKMGSPYPTGFEHLEVVLETEFSKLSKILGNFEFDSKMNFKGLEKPINQEVGLELDEFLACKFHHYALCDLVEIEHEEKLQEVIEQVFRRISIFNPMLSGSKLIGCGSLNSDVDILICEENLEKLNEFLNDEFSNFQIQSRFSVHRNQKTLISNFELNNFKFEIFASQEPVFKQHSHRHYLVESRLLRLFGKKLKSKILEYKNTLKFNTESAFGKALSILPGTEMDELYKDSFLSEKKLYEKYLKQGSL